jgi:hypothetical protein
MKLKKPNKIFEWEKPNAKDLIKLDMLKSTCPRWPVGQVDKIIGGSFTKFSSQINCDLLEWYYFDIK